MADGVTTRAKSSSVPTTCTAIVTTSASSTTNDDPERPHRHAPGLRHLGVDRGEREGPGHDPDAERQQRR